MNTAQLLTNPSDQAEAPRHLWMRDPLDPSVVVLCGYGISLTVSRGHLVLADGVGRQRRERKLPRAQRQVRRVVILGQTGHVSLEAIGWCLDTGVALAQLDTLGHVLMHAGGRGRDDARLRRAQALAIHSNVAVSAARELIEAKINGQADVLRRRLVASQPTRETTAVLEGMSAVADLASSASSLNDLMALEADAAARYFNAWRGGARVRFARNEAGKVPEHWYRFITRQSLIHPGTSARDAADPINALLNYGYALAETECILALCAVGLDPGLGVMHTDQPNRASLALDIIEPLRPVVDDLILQLLERRAFTREDFTETSTGACRLTPLLAAELAGHMIDLAPVAAHYAENVAAIFAAAADGPVKVTRRLTNAKRREPVASLVGAAPRSNAGRTCRTCGAPLTSNERQHCRPCWDATRLTLAADNLRASNERLAELRRLGVDPRRTDTAVAKQADGISRNRQAALAWVPTPEEAALTSVWYDEVLFPRLQAVSVRAIQDAAGVSNTAASRIRRGTLRPHRRHWSALAHICLV